jgi:hypothetical protein
MIDRTHKLPVTKPGESPGDESRLRLLPAQAYRRG